MDEARMKTSLSQFTQDNPLAVGAVALAFGMVIGLSLRRTDSENRAFGAMKDLLLDKAEEAALGLTHAVSEQVREAVARAPGVERVVERVAGPKFWPNRNQAG
jgi:hypothetical protein